MAIETGWDKFIALCFSAKNEEQLSSLLTFFLTAEEKDDIAARALIVKALLTQEMPQRQMAEILKVSIAKITRGSNELKRIDKKLRVFLIDELVDKK